MSPLRRFDYTASRSGEYRGAADSNILCKYVPTPICIKHVLSNIANATGRGSPPRRNLLFRSLGEIASLVGEPPNNLLIEKAKKDDSMLKKYSEESDGEGGLGNLNRLIVRPPGHSGKAKRGQLCFDAAFECGNLGRADHITELEYDLYIRPDTCRPRARFGFNFTVENVKQDQRVIFNFINFGKERTLFDGNMTPLVRSTSRQKWQRIPRRLIFYHRSLVHRGRKILSIAFAFDREEDVYHFATVAPYSYSRLQKYLATWEKRAQAFATREAIAETTQKRRVDLITVGDTTSKEKELEDDEEHVRKTKVPEPKKRVVLIIARAHGGEHPSSFICQGFLDYLVSSSEKACALRNGIILYIIPMLNPDGVFLGNQRSDLLGSDLNRCWSRATSYAHPALIAVNDLVKKIMAEKSTQLDFVIDIHADVSHEGVFIRGNSYDDIFRFERHAVLPKFLGSRVEAWQPQNCLYNMDNNSTGSARRTLSVGSVDAYTLLASIGGRRLSLKGPYLHYTEDAYGLNLKGKLGWLRPTHPLGLNDDMCRAILEAGDCHAAFSYIYVDFGDFRLLYGLQTCCNPFSVHHFRYDFKIGRSLVKVLCDYYRHINVIARRVPVVKKEQRGRRRRRRPVYERERSPSSSRERRVLATRVLTPPLPPASPPLLQAPPPRRPPFCIINARPHTVPTIEHILPIIRGTALPRLNVVDMSSFVRSPIEAENKQRINQLRPAKVLRRPPVKNPRLTSDDSDTHDSES